jgi:hypothetical protein
MCRNLDRFRLSPKTQSHFEPDTALSDHALTRFTKEITSALDEIGRDFTAHSIFSPSGSAMWANCSGSLVPNLFAPDDAGEDAATGTVAHSVAEMWLKSGTRPDHLIGETWIVTNAGVDYAITIDESMLDYVSQYVDWCIYLPGSHFVETRVDHSDLTPLKNQTGTADHAACEIGKLTITDLKFGQGHLVFAENNTQGIIYAYGFFKKYDELFDFKTIAIRIAQPRLGHFDEWVIAREELLQWAAWLKERAFAAWCKDAKRTPSAKACQWCRVSTDCASRIVFTERLLDGVFDNLTAEVTAEEMSDLATRLDSGMYSLNPVGIGSLTVAQKAVLLPFRSMVESWFKDLQADLTARCINGEHVPGYKIVEGRSTREFTSVTSAADTLDFLGVPDEVIHPRGMISPAQAETALINIGYKRKELPTLLGQVIRKPPGKTTMAPDSDRRQAVVSAGYSFDNLDEEL